MDGEARSCHQIGQHRHGSAHRKINHLGSQSLQMSCGAAPGYSNAAPMSQIIARKMQKLDRGQP